MIISEEAYEREGRIHLETPIKVFRGTRDSEILSLGLAHGIDPVTGLKRKLWGLVDSHGGYLSHMCYEVSRPLMGPPALLADLRKRGADRFTFHSGIPLWTTLEELTRALVDLGLAAPDRYRGVKVPEALVPNWDQPEADWWRRGVDAATLSMSLKLHGLAEEIQVEGIHYE
jgi:hypothetical protein